MKQEQNELSDQELGLVSLEVDVATMSVAIHREYARLLRSSLASLAHLLGWTRRRAGARSFASNMLPDRCAERTEPSEQNEFEFEFELSGLV